MNEMNQIRVFLAFLFVFAVMTLSQTVMAASSAVPSVPGYANGGFKAAAGSFTMMAANEGYIKPSVVNVGGRSITVPATLRMAANAGQYAKNAMRFNPYVLAGTLAAGYLLENGLEYSGAEWNKTVPAEGTYPDGKTWTTSSTTTGDCRSGSLGCSEEAASYAAFRLNQPTHTYEGCSYSGGANPRQYICAFRYLPPNAHITSTTNVYIYRTANDPANTVRPASDDDWDSLPDPLPSVAPELPNAPYMPDGVPVEPPSYEFAPMNVPVGSPYTKPDGSTWQPMASVSPGGDDVVIDTYDQPINDPQGNPVPNPTPSDTPEPPPNHCEQNPNTIGCAQFGDAGTAEAIPTTTLPATVSVTPVGGSGVCPADVVTTRFGITWTYQPICDFASAVRPFVLGFAWLSFAFVVAGAVRT